MISESTDAVHAAQIDTDVQALIVIAKLLQTAIREGYHETAVELSTRLAAQTHHLENDTVMRARRWGSDWADIGRARGTTRQAARQRFGLPHDN